MRHDNDARAHGPEPTDAILVTSAERFETTGQVLDVAANQSGSRDVRAKRRPSAGKPAQPTGSVCRFSRR